MKEVFWAFAHANRRLSHKLDLGGIKMNYYKKDVTIKFQNQSDSKADYITYPSRPSSSMPDDKMIEPVKNDTYPEAVAMEEMEPEIVPVKKEMEMKMSLYDVDEAFTRGTVLPDLYLGYRNFVPKVPKGENERKEKEIEISKHLFYAHEMMLLADVYPNNSQFIELYHKHRGIADNLVKDFEKEYGPITPTSDQLGSSPWGWINNPWPWQR